MRNAAFLLVLLATGSAAAAEDACTSFKWPIAREQKAFAAPGLPGLPGGGPLPAGGAVRLTLAPQASVSYTVQPAKTPKHSPAYGAQLSLEAPPSTSLQVTLSGDAWVDVVQNGKALRSTAFSGMTGCAGIRKSVRFSLAPGPAVIAISDSPAATLDLAVVPVE